MWGWTSHGSHNWTSVKWISEFQLNCTRNNPHREGHLYISYCIFCPDTFIDITLIKIFNRCLLSDFIVRKIMCKTKHMSKSFFHTFRNTKEKARYFGSFQGRCSVDCRYVLSVVFLLVKFLNVTHWSALELQTFHVTNIFFITIATCKQGRNTSQLTSGKKFYQQGLYYKY